MAELGANDQAFAKKFETAINTSDGKQINSCLEQWQNFSAQQKQEALKELNSHNLTAVIDGDQLIVGNPDYVGSNVKVFKPNQQGKWEEQNAITEMQAKGNKALIAQYDQNKQQRIRDSIPAETQEKMREGAQKLRQAAEAIRESLFPSDKRTKS